MQLRYGFWTNGDRRGPIYEQNVNNILTAVYGYDYSWLVWDTEIYSYEVKGMITGFDSVAKSPIHGCLNHEDSPGDEITVHGGTPAILCDRSMSLSAIGNRICNGRLNVPAYGFDSGDCCLPELQCVSPYHALIC